MNYDAKKPIFTPEFIYFLQSLVAVAILTSAGFCGETTEADEPPANGAPNGGTEQSPPIVLKGIEHDGSSLRVKTIVEISGSLRPANQAETTEEVPVTMHAELFYDQLGLAGNGFPALRHYWEAKASLEFNGNKSERKLRPQRASIRLSSSDPDNRVSSTDGPLLREELELIDVTTDGYPLERLLPTAAVQLEESWDLTDEVARDFLRLERIESGALSCRLITVTDTIAKIEVSGDVRGVAEGAKTSMTVTGNYQFDRQKSFVKWVAISIHEKRESSFATPSFDVTARIRSAREVPSEISSIDAKQLDQRPTPTEADRMLEFVADGDLFRMLLDRRWHTIRQARAGITLRMVQRGDLLASCKIDRLNKLPPGKTLRLDGYQQDVKNALGKNCQQILQTEETTNPHGVRTLRVSASGMIQEAPIQWVYCHLSTADGRAVSVIFTYESSVADRFVGFDEALINSIEFPGSTVQANRIDANRK